MPAQMTNAEFTAFLNTEAAARAESRTLANIARRAATLFTDGYTAYQSPTFPRLWTVVSPEGKTYAVRAASVVPGDEFLGDTCDCPCFAKHGTCKHLQAVLLNAETEAEASQCAEHDARTANAEAFDIYEAHDMMLETLTAGRTVYGGSLHSEL